VVLRGLLEEINILGPPADLLSRITTVNLLFHAVEKFLQPRGPGGEIYVFGHRTPGNAPPYTVDYQTPSSLHQSIRPNYSACHRQYCIPPPTNSHHSISNLHIALLRHSRQETIGLVREHDHESLSEVRGLELVLEDDSIVRERSVQTAAGISLVTPSLGKLWLNLCRVQLYIVSFHHHRRTRLDRGSRPCVHGVCLYIVDIVDIDRSSSKAREGAQSFKSISHVFKESEVAVLTSLEPGISARIYVQMGSGRLGCSGKLSPWGYNCKDRRRFKSRHTVVTKQME